jgi:poly(A) polymerase
MTRLENQPWMTAPETVKLLRALGDARFVGGAVRNALLAKPVTEVDIATPLTPPEVEQRLAAARIKAVPTGIEHGTITAVVGGKPFEVTTLRRDVETDGRRAVVAFTTDWALDAQRRDFTMNALYASPDGEVLDTVGGVEDLKAGRVRFVGDAVMRIREDYLRILRLFRFHAFYGAGEIDAEALRAATQEKRGIARLSGERIAKEMLRLLEAEEPVAVLRTMAHASVLSEVLPGEPNIARLANLVAIDTTNSFKPDPLLRLAALMPGPESAVPAVTFAHEVAKRWRLSNAQRDRLEEIARSDERLTATLSAHEVRKLVYRLGKPRAKDLLLLHWAEDPTDAAAWRALLAIAEAWERPRFPLTGADVMRAGVPEGPRVGQVLAELEAWWVDGDFAADAPALARRLKELVH